jgi:uncharacterized protein YqjF (DUF2071 family)
MTSVVMHQKWRDLLFLHWPIEADAVQATLPPGLMVDTWDGQAWLGVVPFRMRAIRPRGCPPLPHVSYFLEANVRTYVRDAQGRPGVWFYSLDANRRLAVWAARRFFSLPYFFARMAATKRADGAWDYRVARGTSTESRFVYAGAGNPAPAAPDSLEHFLVERYRLYSWRGAQRGLWTGEVEHVPYPCEQVQLGDADARLIGLAGFDTPTEPPAHALYSRGVDVRVRRIEPA